MNAYVVLRQVVTNVSSFPFAAFYVKDLESLKERMGKDIVEDDIIIEIATQRKVKFQPTYAMLPISED